MQLHIHKYIHVHKVGLEYIDATVCKWDAVFALSAYLKYAQVRVCVCVTTFETLEMTAAAAAEHLDGLPFLATLNIIEDDPTLWRLQWPSTTACQTTCYNVNNLIRFWNYDWLTGMLFTQLTLFSDSQQNSNFQYLRLDNRKYESIYYVSIYTRKVVFNIFHSVCSQMCIFHFGLFRDLLTVVFFIIKKSNFYFNNGHSYCISVLLLSFIFNSRVLHLTFKSRIFFSPFSFFFLLCLLCTVRFFLFL